MNRPEVGKRVGILEVATSASDLLESCSARIRRALRGWLAPVWLTVWLFSLQLGPIYTMRLKMGPLRLDFIDDPFVTSWFTVLDAIALVMFVAGGRFIQRRRDGLSGALICWWVVLALSMLWSVDQVRTFSQVVMLAGSMTAAYVAATIVSRRVFLLALFVSSQVGALIAYRSVKAHWIGAIDDYGSWVGIYLNRNSLGPVVVLGLLSGLLLVEPVVELLRTRRRMWTIPAVVIAALPLAAVDLELLRGSGSASPVVAAAAALGVTGVCVVVRRMFGRRRPAELARAIYVGLGGLVVLALILRPLVPRWFGKSTDLNRRGEIWSLVVSAIRTHPIRGWGWMGAWTDPDYMATVVGKLGQPIGSAHNGFLEVLLGVGAVGAIPLVVVVVLLIRRAVSAAAAGGELALLPLALLAYALVANLTESFIGANLLPWTLAVAAGYMARTELPGGRERDVQN